MKNSPPETKRIKLPDGRQLAYSEFGDPRGTPVLFFHGWPGARLQGQLADDPAKEKGIRYIASDRPGFGQSDFKAGRSILDWPQDILELANQLDFNRFAVLGLSGGAPYAYACGLKLAENVKCVGIISGIGPVDIPGAEEGVSPSLKRMILLTRRVPWLVGILLGRSSRRVRRDPEGSFQKLLSSLPEPDRLALTQPGVKERALTARIESFRPGARGHLLEIGLFARPWGFSCAEIQKPVLLWHGEQDQEILPSTAHHVVASLKNCRATFLPQEGHYSLYINHIEGILRDMSSDLTKAF